jgi:hypothetical protein
MSLTKGHRAILSYVCCNLHCQQCPDSPGNLSCTYPCQLFFTAFQVGDNGRLFYIAMFSMCLKVGGTHSAHDEPHVGVAGPSDYGLRCKMGGLCGVEWCILLTTATYSLRKLASRSSFFPPYIFNLFIYSTSF